MTHIQRTCATASKLIPSWVRTPAGQHGPGPSSVFCPGLPSREVSIRAQPSVFSLVQQTPGANTYEPRDAGHVQMTTTPGERDRYADLQRSYGHSPKQRLPGPVPVIRMPLVVPQGAVVVRAPHCEPVPYGQDPRVPFGPAVTKVIGPELTSAQAQVLKDVSAGPFFPAYNVGMHNCVAATHETLRKLGYPLRLPPSGTVGMTPQLLASLLLQVYQGEFRLDERKGLGRTISLVEQLLGLHLPDLVKATLVANLALIEQLGRNDGVFEAVARLLGRQHEFNQGMHRLRVQQEDEVSTHEAILNRQFPLPATAMRA